MNNYLKEYRASLKTIGPLFIGSGKEIHKKEYLLNRQTNTIDVIDLVKMYAYMRKKGLFSEFENFFFTDLRKDLFGWLKDHRIMTSEIKGCMKYSIDQSDTVLEKGKPTNIMEFVKDPYGKPYVPGSSIKGMLRTILLSSDIMNNIEKYRLQSDNLKIGISRRAGRNVYCKKEQSSFEVKAFNTLQRPDTRPGDAVNDMLSGLIVSDSDPLEINDLALCQKIDYHVDASEKRFNVLRECIKPGVEIKFRITIDETVCSITRDGIMSAINSFADMYDEAFMLKFKGIKSSDENTVYLGGGVGFVSKTDVYPVFGAEEGISKVMDIFRNTNVPSEHKHIKDRALGVSPHILKMTKYKGRLYQMGECAFDM